MTQQPYYPPAQPPQGYPPQQPPAQPMPQQYPPQYPQAPQQPYAPQQPGYPAQQGYGQPAPPPAPLAQGSLDAFYSQPSAGSGPGVGWTDKQGNQRPIGTTWAGVVARDVTNSDVQQMTDIKTGVPLFLRDGSPKFQMKVPLKQVALFNDPQLQQPLPLPAEMTEGEGTWYVKGQPRDELSRAMAEAGVVPDPGQPGVSPKAGALVFITLVNRRGNGGGMNPTNIVQVRYVPGEAGQAAPAAPPAAAPTSAPQAQQYAPQEQLPPTPAAQPQYQQPAPQQVQQPGYPPQAVPQQAQQQAQQQGAPQGQPQFADPEQQALFDRIRQGQQPGQPAA